MDHTHTLAILCLCFLAQGVTRPCFFLKYGNDLPRPLERSEHLVARPAHSSHCMWRGKEEQGGRTIVDALPALKEGCPAGVMGPQQSPPAMLVPTAMGRSAGTSLHSCSVGFTAVFQDACDKIWTQQEQSQSFMTFHIPHVWEAEHCSWSVEDTKLHGSMMGFCLQHPLGL